VYEYPDGIAYPGMINPMTSLGITGISSVKEENDINETGKFNPHVSVYTAFYPWNNLIPNTRDFGTIVGLIVPEGELICGKAALVSFYGWTPEDMIIKKEAALRINIPELVFGRRRGPIPNDALMKSIETKKNELRDFISKAYRYYLRSTSQAPLESSSDDTTFDSYYSRYEAMLPVWKENFPVIIRAQSAENIRFAIQLGKDFKMNVILADAYDGENVLKEIKESRFPVILSTMFAGNKEWSDGVDKVFRLPGKLAKEGVLFSFSSFASSTAYDYALQAGRAVAYGLSQEDAIKGLTVYPAKILGLDRYGSLEKGKTASFIIASGNLLETDTVIKDVFMNGKKVTAKSFYQQEYQRAKDKISGQY